MKTLKALLLVLFAASVAYSQGLGPSGGSCTADCASGSGSTAMPAQFKASASANTTASNGDVVARKQLTNVGTGCNSGTITPTGVPKGQLYSTSAVKTSAEAAGCPVQGYVFSTFSGSGISAVGNGNNAGGTDSPTAITDTYGGTATDTFCSGDAQYASLVGTVVHDIAMPACASNSSAQFGQTTVAGNANADSLWPSDWNMTGLDGFTHAYRSMFFRVTNLANLHDFETDTNHNTSAGYYNGWGAHWNETVQMWQACPQGCSGWKTMKFTPVGGGSAVTSYPLTEGHIYFLAFWYHRDSVSTCTPSSASNCYFYDYAMVYDVTAGETAKLYAITDTSGNPIGGIPQDRSTWSKNLITSQFQIDATRAGNITIDVSNDGTIIY